MASTGFVETLSGILSTSLASTVKGYHVNRAIEFYNRKDLYFAFAHEEPWPEETVPAPEYYDTLLNPWGFKKVESKFLVVPDEVDGTIVFQNKKFSIVSVEEAMEKGARWVYLMSYVSFNELPLKTYRQVGLNTSLVVSEGVAGNAFTPDQLVSQGVTEIINNRVGIGREADLREMVSIVIEF